MQSPRAQTLCASPNGGFDRVRFRHFDVACHVAWPPRRTDLAGRFRVQQPVHWWDWEWACVLVVFSKISGLPHDLCSMTILDHVRLFVVDHERCGGV